MDDETAEAEQEGGGFDLAVLRGYVQFARSALRAHWRLSLLVALGVFTLTGLALRFIPKTYSCTTSLMAVENAVLDQNGGARPLVGAQGLLMRHENLEQVIKDTRLVDTNWERRPPLLALKDRVVSAIRGPMSRETKLGVLVGTLETRIGLSVKDSILEITVDWNDPVTCAELAEAIRDNFLELRHTAEISAFQEKIEILNQHAGQLRQEVDVLAEQMKTTLAARAEEVTRTGTTAPRRSTTSVAPARKAGPDEGMLETKRKLAEARKELTAAENVRSARLASEQSKLDELKLRFTPSHPQVIVQEERVAIASDVPSSLALLRSEVADLEAQMGQHEGAGAARKSLTSGSTEVASSGLLPTAVMRLLEREDVDPALGARMRSAVIRYGSLIDGVQGSKLALDTAQAAFKHRYQVVIPAEEPTTPAKPKPLMIGAVGAFLALLLAFLVPILLALRRGVLVERWQMDMLMLPVLGDLNFPAKKD